MTECGTSLRLVPHRTSALHRRGQHRVPLFFYVLHNALAHLAAGLIALAAGYGTAVLTASFKTLPEGWGYGLAGVYVAWLLVLVALYPACRWFAGVKRRRTDWWLSYL